MIRSGTALILAAMIGATTIGVAAPAAADQTDPRLGELFDALRTGDSATAAPIEAEIWRIWLETGRAEVASLMARGVVEMNAGHGAAALALFDQIVAMAPDYAEGWNKRATLLYVLGRYPESIRDIDRTLALEPRHFGALSGLGLCNVQLGRDEAALEAFQRAASVDPSLAGVRDNIAALKLKIARERT